jgi:hypothetical protein
MVLQLSFARIYQSRKHLTERFGENCVRGHDLNLNLNHEPGILQLLQHMEVDNFDISRLIIRIPPPTTGAYSPGRTFGLHFQGFFISHIQTHGRTPLDE